MRKRGTACGERIARCRWGSAAGSGCNFSYWAASKKNARVTIYGASGA
jgi:hypothetical protein